MQKKWLMSVFVLIMLLAMPLASAQCTDTEGIADVADIYKKGTATDGNGAKTDSCDGNILTEFYCDIHGVVVAKSPYECPYGCLNGACIKGEQLCMDSDGRDEYKKGTTTGLETVKTRATFTDYCGVSGDEAGKLVEYYCDNDYVKKSIVTCMHGECKEGACITTSDACKDSDGGKSYYVKGEAVLGTARWIDSCADNGVQLHESYCENGALKDEVYSCPAGCKEGACILKINACADSDKGLDYYNKGTIRGTDSYGTTLNVEESCLDTKTLNECYCTEQTYLCQKYSCPAGCKDGACLKESATASCKDTDNSQDYSKESPSDLSIGGSDRYTKGITSWENYGDSVDKCINIDNNNFLDSCESNAGFRCGVQEYYCYLGGRGARYIVCPNGCKDGACLKGEETTEQVKCVFAGSSSGQMQQCYSADSGGSRFKCEGQESCVMDVKGYSGEQITWKSSCGGYAYTTMDGVNEYAEFKCGGGETTTTEIQNKGFRNAYWQCYDGYEEKSGNGVCKSSEIWQSYAKKSCEGHCYADASKCGVNSFSVFNECYLDEVVPGVEEEIQEIITITLPTEEEPEFLICKDSCASEGKCYPFGYRKSGKYCSDEGVFVVQLEESSACDNDFECDSNVCAGGECIGVGLIQKIINFFKNLFS